MATSTSVNHSPTFTIPGADTDAFTSDMLEVALAALDLDDHSLNKGPAVKRISSGVLASRPAAGNAGHVYVATDTDSLSFDDGTNWKAVVVEGIAVSSAGILLTNNTAKISIKDSGGVARQAIYGASNDSLRIYPIASGGNVLIRDFADTVNHVTINDAGGMSISGLLSSVGVTSTALITTTTLTASGLITATAGLTAAARIQGAKGANVAAANSLTLGTDGNLFTITGNTQINLLDTTGWQAGSAITLLFTGTPTVKHNQAPSTTFQALILNGAADLVAAANNTLSLVYNGTSWFEVGRKV